MPSRHARAGGRQTTRSVRRRRLVSAVMCLLLLGPAARAQAQGDVPAPPMHPRSRWLLDAPLLVSGATLLLVSRPLSVTRQVVPPQGLNPNTIFWSFDRSVVGNASTRADRASDYFAGAALAYPMMLAFVSQPSGTRWSGTLRRALVYSETILIAEGMASVLKNLADRPRPFTYLPVDQRPTTPAFDVTADEAFRSMPSGHATLAFSAATFAMTDHLISRPNASWQERVAISSLGGVMAGMTGLLRVEGGQHFPSDVIVGGLIGTASGITVPLVHHYITADGHRAGLPSGRAWWQAIAGYVGGIGVGIVAAKLLY
jgi:membrane-associated phospholipid phosphatase